MGEKPSELLMCVIALIAAGAVGLIGVFLADIRNPGLAVALTAAYGAMHPLLAYALWALLPGALKAARLFIIIFLLSSFFFYSMINPIVLIFNALIYAYTLMYLFRPDVMEAFNED